MSKLICTEEIDWKGTIYSLELYKSETIPADYPVSQCQAVAFLDPENVVIYKHRDGYYGLPGGQVENDEEYETALQREIEEEIACKTTVCKLIGYLKDTNLTTGKTTYQLRYMAKVTLLNQPVNDPAGKALERKIVSVDDVAGLLNWQNRGQMIVDLATEALES